MKIQYSIRDKVNPKECFDLAASLGFAKHRKLFNYKNAISGSSFIATARHNGNLIGIIRLISDGGYIIHVAEIMINKEYQRKGIGTRLLKLGIKYAKEIRIGTGTNLGEFTLFANTGAVEYYKNSQFSLCPNGMVLTDCPERMNFEGKFQKQWKTRHKKEKST